MAALFGVSLVIAGASGCGGGPKDHVDARPHTARVDGSSQGQPAQPVRNGPIFVVRELERFEGPGLITYAVWRGGLHVPFRKLQGAKVRSGTPCVSPNGSRLAYLGWPKAQIVVRRIYRSRTQLGSPKVIGRLPVDRGGVHGDCAWSPDGYSIVLVAWGRRSVEGVWRLQRNGEDLRQAGERLGSGNVGAPGEPAWSSTGRIAFLDPGDYPRLSMMDASGANLRRLDARGHSPAWSPDGQKLAFIKTFDTIAAGPVLVANADGDDAHRLRRRNYNAVAFSPDGRRLALARACLLRRGRLRDRITITRGDGTPTHTIRTPGSSSACLVGLMWARAPQR